MAKNILVVGGGISGLTAALEAAEAGREVILIEKNPYLGGRVAQMNQYFPKLCPPNCGLEINFKRLKANPRLKIFTLAEITDVRGEAGDFTVTVTLHPRGVNQQCTGCGQCEAVCPVSRPNAFNYGLDRTKAIYRSHPFAFPARYVIDAAACPGESCGQCVAACPYQAIELGQADQTVTLNVGAVIWATGWVPYDAGRISYYGFGRYPDVVTNVMFERLAAPDGPTKGRIVRLSDGGPVNKIAFIQCAGSRDENHLSYCSGVCCLASLKQATYIKAQHPGAQVYIYYIDIRALGKYEDFFTQVQSQVTLIKGKAGEITADPGTGNLVVIAEDQLRREITRETFDLVVLATGMVPVVPAGVARTPDGFIAPSPPGQYGAGGAKKPQDVAAVVQDATAAALYAIQSTVGGSNNG